MSVAIGDIKTNIKGFKYEIIELVKMKPRNRYRVKFIETGYETLVEFKEANNGGVRDWLAPYVCGVGVVGVEIDHPQSHFLYDRWRDMLRRCYDKKNKLYKDYGAVGVVVCDEWKYFPNYVRDIEGKENSDKLKNDSKNWQIDKDIKYKNNKIYSNDTTLIVTRIENTKERNERQGNPSKHNMVKVLQLNEYGDIVNKFDSIALASESFGTENGSWISNCCNNKGLTFKGYYWSYESQYKNKELFMDKIQKRKAMRGRSRQKYKLYIKLKESDEEVVFYNNDEACDYIKVSKCAIYNAIYRNKGNTLKCNGYIIRYEELN